MKKYTVEFSEIIKRTTEVEAEDWETAMHMVWEKATYIGLDLFMCVAHLKD